MKTAPRIPPLLYVLISSIWTLALLMVLASVRLPSGQSAVNQREIPLALALIVFVALSGAMPLLLAPTVKIHVGTAPLFAATLLFPVPIAVCIGLVGTIAYHAYLQAQRRRIWQDLAFNTGRTVLQVALAGSLFHTLVHGQQWQVVTTSPSLAAAATLSGLVYYLTNALTVYGATALLTRQHPVVLWWSSVRIEAPQQAALLLFGVVTAVVAGMFPVLGLAMVFPVCVVYYSLRSSMALRVHTQSAVEAIADAVDMRSFGSSGHSRRVADLAVQLAHRLGMSQDEVELVRRAARVHDIGKVGFADAILRQEPAAQPESLAELRRHPAFGAEILAPFAEYQRCRHLVRWHHERPDGNGYPDGRAGTQIPLGAAVIGVAETFDALTTDRPYREAISQAQALTQMQRGADTIWDARVLQALSETVQAKDPARSGVPTSAPIPG